MLEKIFEDKEYLSIVENILNHKEYVKRKKFKHHGEISVYEHCLRVSYMSYNIAKKFKSIDPKNLAIGGLLHDFYYKSWVDNPVKKKFFEKHGFVHAREALENSKKFFPLELNEIIEDIILKHMFPLNIKLPKYKESWIIIFVDKWVSLEVLAQPDFFLDMLGIKKKK